MSPEEEEITYTLRFDFHTSNNEAEYLALLVDLWLAKQMGAKAIVVLTDSRLAANQINREYEFKDRRMENICEGYAMACQAAQRVHHWAYPKRRNRRVDALSKVA